MNVASKELCEELYKLSGWDYFAHGHMYVDGELIDYHDGSRRMTDHKCPAYDLGYLLRKLPEGLSNLVLDTQYSNQWEARWTPLNTFMTGYVEVADTPDDAVCKLAIDLFKQGVLQHV